MTLLYADASERTRRAIIALVFGYWLIRVAMFPIADLADLPVSIAEPVSLLRLLSGDGLDRLLEPVPLIVLQLATLACLLPSALGFGLRWAGLSACLLLTVWESAVRTFNFVNHAQIPILLSAYGLTLLAWAHWFHERRRPARDAGINLNAFAPLLVLMVLLFSYSLTAGFRLAYGTPAVFTSGSIVTWAVSRGLLYTDFPIQLGWGRHAVSTPILGYVLHAGFPVVTLVELIAPFALVSRWVRWLAALVLIPFHVMTFVFMNVLFFENLLLLVLLIDIGRWFGRAPATEPAIE